MEECCLCNIFGRTLQLPGLCTMKRLAERHVVCVQFQLLAAGAALAVVAFAVRMWRSAASATYLVDFYSFRPPTRSAPCATDLRSATCGVAACACHSGQALSCSLVHPHGACLIGFPSCVCASLQK